jgi:hypothetical protein
MVAKLPLKRAVTPPSLYIFFAQPATAGHSDTFGSIGGTRHIPIRFESAALGEASCGKQLTSHAETSAIGLPNHVHRAHALEWSN